MAATVYGIYDSVVEIKSEFLLSEYIILWFKRNLILIWTIYILTSIRRKRIYGWKKKRNT